MVEMLYIYIFTFVTLFNICDGNTNHYIPMCRYMKSYIYRDSEYNILFC